MIQQVPYKYADGNLTWKETVRTTIEFVPPAGFDLKSKEIEPVFLAPFLLGCQRKIETFRLPHTVRLLEYQFPSKYDIVNLK